MSGYFLDQDLRNRIDYSDILESLIGSYLPALDLPISEFVTFSFPKPETGSLRSTIASLSPLSPEINLTNKLLRSQTCIPSVNTLLSILESTVTSAKSVVVPFHCPSGKKTVRLSLVVIKVWALVYEVQSIQSVWRHAMEKLDSTLR